MALVLADRVRDTTTTTGTGTVTLSGTAPTGYQNFSVVGNGNTTYYTINAGSQWEVGLGTYSSTGPTLARTTVIASSNSGSAVDFAVGTKDVFVTYPAEESVYQDGASIAAGTSVLGVANGGTATNTQFTSGSVVFAGASGVYSQDNANLFWDNTNDRLGIGTSSPLYQATVLGLGQDTAALTDAGNKGGSLYLQATGVTGGSGGALLFGTTFGNQTPFAAIKGLVADGTSNTIGDLAISNRNAFTDTALTERLRITSAGNVGIGTSSPTAKVQVFSNGPPAPSGNMNTGMAVASAAGSFAINIGANATGGYTWLNSAYINASSTASPMVFMTGAAECMRISSAGSVGIGTSSPNGILDVSGTFRVQSNGDVLGASSNAGAILLCGGGAYNAGGAVKLYGSSNGDLITFYTGAFSERMRIDSSGNVGVGTSTATQRFEVVGGTLTAGTQSSYAVGIANAGGGSNGDLTFGSDGSFAYVQSWGGKALILNGQGNEVRIAGTTDQGAYNLQVNGTGVWGAGAYVNGSDRSLKEDIAPLADALDVVNALKPVTFRYKEDYSKDQSIQPGFIAQELQEALDGEVYVDGVVQAGPEHLNVAYQSLIPVLVRAIQELTARVAQLEGN